MTSTPTILDDNIPIINFNLTQGVATSILVTLAATPAVTITSAWAFEINLYIGRPLVKTVIITRANGSIVIDAAAMTALCTFLESSIAAIAAGSYAYDMRFTDADGIKGQVFKGIVTIGPV